MVACSSKNAVGMSQACKIHSVRVGDSSSAVRQVFCTVYDSRRFVIECPAPSTTIFLIVKNSIVFISALSLAAMMLASCESIPSAYNPFAEDDPLPSEERATTIEPSDTPIPGVTIKSHP